MTFALFEVVFHALLLFAFIGKIFFLWKYNSKDLQTSALLCNTKNGIEGALNIV
jgi:hypothetical protein